MTRISAFMVRLRDGRRMAFDVWFDIFVAPDLQAVDDFNLQQSKEAA